MKHARADYDRIQDPAGLIPADEPVFLVRGQDPNGGELVRDWADRNDESGGSPEASRLARAHAPLMDGWPKKKLTDLPGEAPPDPGGAYRRTPPGEMLASLMTLLESDLPARLDEPGGWDSLVIDRRKPATVRVFCHLENGRRLALHRFSPCADHEAFAHPHPWPGAFMILAGRYRMWRGRSGDRLSRPVATESAEFGPGSSYEVVDPLVWHSIVPLAETWTVMLSGPPWPARVAHISAPTTRGKDLGRLGGGELADHLRTFARLLRDGPPSSSAMQTSCGGDPADIRAAGWAVAVHNDYRQNGLSHTFWLFTKGGYCVKGEGETDAVALARVRERIAALPPD